MTRRILLIWLGVVTAFLTLFVLVGVLLRIVYSDPASLVYPTYKDFVPVAIAIPAAWLSFCFQRRAMYVQHLRALWTKLIQCTQEATHYTQLSSPTEEEYWATLKCISCGIDEVRGVFKNIGETPADLGLYPFEPLKEMWQTIRDLGYGSSFSPGEATEARKQIFDLWKSVRQSMLREFDREFPTYAESRYLVGNRIGARLE